MVEPSGGALYDIETKYSIKSCDSSASNKTQVKSSKPSSSYIDVTFNSDSEIAFFQYLVFQNYYTASVNIKQFIGSNSNMKEEMKVGKNWVTVLKNYQLMRNAHFEGDAQNWHIIGVDLFNTKFQRRQLKVLRVCLRQPSPNWLDNTLRTITPYMKKTDFKGAESYEEKAPMNPFDGLKNKLKHNIQGIKKQAGNSNQPEQLNANGLEGVGITGYLQGIPGSGYHEDIRRVELVTNIL